MTYWTFRLIVWCVYVAIVAWFAGQGQYSSAGIAAISIAFGVALRKHQDRRAKE